MGDCEENMMTKNKGNSLNNSVTNAFSIIDYLTGRDWCRIKDIAEHLDLDVSTVYRLLKTMQTRDFIQFDQSTHRYKLGFKFFTIAYHMSQSGLIAASSRYMEWMAAETGATINMGKLNNNQTDVIQIYRLDGDPSSRLEDIPIGLSKPINVSALGKCILAFLPFGEQKVILEKIDYPQYTPRSIIMLEDMQKEIQQVRKQGYALDNGEYHENLFCIF